MFEEIEKVSSEKKDSTGESKLFEIDGLTNKDIGKKIKSFSKFFLKFQLVLYIIAAVIMLFVCFSAGEEGVISYIIMLVVFGIAFVGSYYVFLIVAGFGALVEDVNSIKTLSYRDSGKVSKKEKYEDLPKL